MNDDFPSSMNLPVHLHTIAVAVVLVIKEVSFCFYISHEELEWNCEVVVVHKFLAYRVLAH